MTSVF